LLTNYPYHNLVSCAGRLDGNSHGLVLCTSDGQLIHRITHPKSKLPKTYIVQTKFPISIDDCDMLKVGIVLDDGSYTLPALVSYLDDGHQRVSLTIVEGKFHQIKRMMIAIHNQVTDLQRISI
jgi:16S rRNA pseudouridine516 synthase